MNYPTCKVTVLEMIVVKILRNVEHRMKRATHRRPGVISRPKQRENLLNKGRKALAGGFATGPPADAVRVQRMHLVGVLGHGEGGEPQEGSGRWAGHRAPSAVAPRAPAAARTSHAAPAIRVLSTAHQGTYQTSASRYTSLQFSVIGLEESAL